MSGKRAVVLSLLISPLLLSCVGSAETTQRRPPAYATLVGISDYEVRCGSSTVIVTNNAIDRFFHEDGTEKSRQEFCSENRSDTRIRNQ